MQGPRPPCRPLALYAADPGVALDFALTVEPSTEHTGVPGADNALAALDAATLAQVAEVLAATDVSYL